MTEMIFKWTGLILLSILIFAVLMVAASIALYQINRFRDRWRWDAEKTIRRDVGLEMSRFCYWFSEDIPAMRAIEVVGLSYLEDGSAPASNVRDKWRERLKNDPHYQNPAAKILAAIEFAENVDKFVSNIRAVMTKYERGLPTPDDAIAALSEIKEIIKNKAQGR